MPEGWYPHEPDDPFYEVDLYLHEHPQILQRHWEQAWRQGRNAHRDGDVALLQARG
jgi:hypothetical protein